MSKIRCAVLGAGWWGTTAHIPAFKAHPLAELIAVQHHDAAQAARAAAHFGVPYAAASVDEVLALPGLQAVAISSTPNLHFPQAKAALERGLHVLIEKPMTFTAAEARELVALAERKSLQVVMSAPWHYTPHAVEAQRLVRAGALGRLKMINILMTNFTMGLYQGKPWGEVFGDSPTLQNAARPFAEPGRASYSDSALAGGGQIYCQVSHVAAYLSFLTGRRPAEVFARFDNAGTSVDVFDSLSLKLDDGTLVSLASHGAPMLSDRQFEVRLYGTEGMLLMELWKGTMAYHNRRCEVTPSPDLPAEFVYPMYAPATNLIDAAAGKAANGSPGVHGAFAMEVIDAACRSAQSGQNVVL
jgi:predicted dehydrogenase